MTAVSAIRTVGELTALKPVFTALPLNSTCEMLGFRENARSKFQVILTPSRLLCVFLVMMPANPAPFIPWSLFHNYYPEYSPAAVVLRCAELFIDAQSIVDFVGIQQSTDPTNSRKWNKMNSKRASHQSSTFIVTNCPSFRISKGRLVSARNHLSNCTGQTRSCQDDLKFAHSTLLGTKYFGGTAQLETYENWLESIQLCYRLFAHSAVVKTRETPNKRFPEKSKIRNVGNKINSRNIRG